MDWENNKYAILMRHGRYDPRTQELIEQGIREVQDSGSNIAKYLQRQGYEGLVKVYSSELARARESAEIVVGELSFPEKLEAILIPDRRLNCDSFNIRHAIRDEKYDVAVFVSHAPDIGSVLGRGLGTGKYSIEAFKR